MLMIQLGIVYIEVVRSGSGLNVEHGIRQGITPGTVTVPESCVQPVELTAALARLT
jgi:hypothetical protein